MKSEARSRSAKTLFAVARCSAIFGGLIFCGLALLTLSSVLGRAILARPVPGDFEIVAMWTAVGIFLFLPWCQLQRGHIKLDLLMGLLPKGVNRVLNVTGSVIFAMIAFLCAVRMSVGLVEVIHDNDVTVILGWPLWIAYPFGVFGFALFAFCCVYTGWHYWKDD